MSSTPRPVFLLQAFSICTSAAFLLFGAVLGEFFILDDFVWLQCAHDTVNGSLGHIFTRDINFFFRPVVHAMFGLLYGLGGPEPALLHSAALVLHGLAAALLSLLALELTGGSRSKGLFAGLTFVLLHPAYSETMVWVSAMAEPMLAIFALLAALAWLRALAQQQPWRGPWLYLAYGATLLALGCKESAVVLWPLLVLLQLVLTRTGKLKMQPPVWVHLPFVLFLGAYLLMQFDVQQQSPLVRSGMYRPRLEAALLLINCVWRLVSVGGLSLMVALAALLVTPRLGGRVTVVAWRPVVFVSLGLLGAILIALLPYAWFKSDMVASRYFYTSTLIISLAVALLMAPVVETSRRRVAAMLGFLLLVTAADTHGAAREELLRYRRAALPVERFIKGAAQLELDGTPTLLINSPLRGLHLRGALYVFHPDHPGNVWGTHKNKVPASWKKKRAYRWDPVSGHFRLIQ